MFDRLVSFWNEILSVFVGGGSYPLYIFYAKDYGTGVLQNNFIVSFSRTQIAYVLSGVTLIGLSVFLFYQIYKVIHAFIGGFYEDAI